MSATVKLVILAAMVFCHIADDYYFQGILAQMKQREWWRQNAPDSMYSRDYRMALFEHAFSWAFVMSMPLLLAAALTGNEDILRWVLVGYVMNTSLHAYVDNEKANKRTINLIQDQDIHLLQVFTLWLFGCWMI